jgi:hypothetical protein
VEFSIEAWSRVCALEIYDELLPKTKYQQWPVYFRPEIDTVRVLESLIDARTLSFGGEMESHDQGLRISQFDVLNKIQNLEIVLPVEKFRGLLEIPLIDLISTRPTYTGKETSRVLNVKLSFPERISDQHYAQRLIVQYQADVEHWLVHLFHFYSTLNEGSVEGPWAYTKSIPKSLKPRKLIFDWEAAFPTV